MYAYFLGKNKTGRKIKIKVCGVNINMCDMYVYFFLNSCESYQYYLCVLISKSLDLLTFSDHSVYSPVDRYVR